MSRQRRDRLTHLQRCVLSSAGADRKLSCTDQRIVRGLVDRGWVRRVSVKTRRRKERVHWEITDAGREALATLPVVEPLPRVRWPSRWHRERISQTDHVIEHSHRIYRPNRDSVWSVLCPDRPPGEAAGYGETLAEAVETLDDHLRNTACERHPDLLPLHYTEVASLDRLNRGPAPEPDPDVVDLDTLTPNPTPPLRLVAPTPNDADTQTTPSSTPNPRPLRLVGDTGHADEHQGDEHQGPMQWDIFGQVHPITTA